MKACKLLLAATVIFLTACSKEESLEIIDNPGTVNVGKLRGSYSNDHN